MDKETGSSTIYFDGSFWVGVFERHFGSFMQVAKVVFGAEPTERQCLEFLLDHWNDIPFGPPLPEHQQTKDRNNGSFKHRMHKTRKEQEQTGRGTKSQQALQAQRNLKATARKREARCEKAMRASIQYRKEQERKRQEHKGH